MEEKGESLRVSRRAHRALNPCRHRLRTHKLPFSRGFVVEKKEEEVHHHLPAGKKSHVRIEQGKFIRFSIAFVRDSIFSLEDSFPPNQPMTSRVCIYSPVDPGRLIKS